MTAAAGEGTFGILVPGPFWRCARELGAVPCSPRPS